MNLDYFKNVKQTSDFSIVNVDKKYPFVTPSKVILPGVEGGEYPGRWFMSSIHFQIYNIEWIILVDLLFSTGDESPAASSVDEGVEGAVFIVIWVPLMNLVNPLEGEILVFNDSITSPKLIKVNSMSYEPSSLKSQLKLETLAKNPS